MLLVLSNVRRLFWCMGFSYLIYGSIIQPGAAQIVIDLSFLTHQQQVLILFFEYPTF